MATVAGLRPLAPGLSLRSFRLVQRVGTGATGDVWSALDARGEEVALKARPIQSADDEQLIRQEFERLRTLRIPNVVRVLTAGSDQGYVFFAMERARGEPLDAWVRGGGDLGQRVHRCVAAGAGVARALAGIHRLRLAHRDIKPANVLVAGDDQITVLDFGTSGFGVLDQDEALAGSLPYMAPEQRIGLPHDHRVDLFALGVTLHEALSGTPARTWRPDEPRRSLLALGAAVPVQLAALVDSLVALDPVERPSAEEAQDLLERLASGRLLPPAPWPAPRRYHGDAGRLLQGSAVVVGLPGSGRRRMVSEARAAWYRKGYRSVAGQCRPDEPFGALAEILRAVLAPLERRAALDLCGPDGPLLAAVVPELPLDDDQLPARNPAPALVGQAMGRLLSRAGPLAVALWDIDDADPGTTRALPHLDRTSSHQVLVWATGTQPGFGLRTILPPAWTADTHAAVVAELAPGTEPGPPASLPLHSAAHAWRQLAADRGLPGPSDPVDPALVALSVLDIPFPRAVAASLCADLQALQGTGQLAVWHVDNGDDTATLTSGQEQLVFRDLGTLALARAAPADRPRLCRAAAQAWLDARELARRVRHGASLALRAGHATQKVLRAAIREELGRGRPGELDRWLKLLALHHPAAEEDFELHYARLLVDLELRPASFSPDDLAALAARARTRREEGLATYLQVVFSARRGDRAAAAELGRRKAADLAARHPRLTADLLREVALANILRGEAGTAVRDARAALARARQAAGRGLPDGVAPPLSRSEVSAMTTLSAALLYAGRVAEAVEQCAEGAARCRAAGLSRGEGALLANQGIGELYLGRRANAEATLARCRAVQGEHRDPVVLANLSVTQARLAVERGDLSAGRVLVDEGLTAARAAGDPHLVGEAWCLVLDAAVHTADPAEAQRALASYGAEGVGSAWDHWPAALARWRWLIGDLDGALRATEEPRSGHGELCIRAERARLLLVGGRYDDASGVARALADDAEASDELELALFARLVDCAARGVSDGEARGPLGATRHSRWVHLYLGALHLDAIRRRLRGENVDALLRQLRVRSRNLGHRLYEALARAEGW